MAGRPTGLTTTLDPDAIVDALDDELDDAVHVVVLYDDSGFEIAHVSDFARSLYDDEAQMHDHFERFHDYVNLDFMERDLFEEKLASDAGSVRAHTTHMDAMTLVRVFIEDTGVFVTTTADADVSAAVSVVEAAVS